MPVNTDESEYTPVEVASLQVGMLLDRPLYVHLPANDRYVLLAKPLQQLEASTLEKLKRFGKAFTVGLSVSERYPKLNETAQVFRSLCDDTERAPFEKNRELYEATLWLYPQIFSPTADLCVPVFLVQLAFGEPQSQTMLHVSDFSVESYERGLRLGAIACVLAAWLGYTNTAFLKQFAQSSFCRELVMLDGIPGVENPDPRFRVLSEIGDDFAKTSDELAEVVELARWLSRGASGAVPRLRVQRKLKRRFEQVGALQSQAVVDSGGKAAA